MSKKIKIYCVLFDTLPFDQKIELLAKKNNMNLLTQVGGCFTNNSCIEMLTGDMPSDLRYHGMGHLCHNKYRHSKTKDISWPWKDKILLNIFFSNGWNIRYHDGEHFSNVISNNKKIKTTSTDRDDTILLNEGKKGKMLMDVEKMFTKKMQMEKVSNNTFYFIRHEHYHKAVDLHRKKDAKKVKHKKKVAIKKSINLMNQWDFNEKNAIFWFFSDHGDWNYPFDLRHPNPQNYFSFALCKDNTKNPLVIKSKYISIRDFFSTFMNKFNYEYSKNSETYSIENKQDKNRIYYVEDGRKKINDDISTTAMACKFVNWEDGHPQGLLQVSYHICDKTWVCRLIKINKNGIAKKIIEKDIIDRMLKRAVIKKFEWVKNE